MHTMYPGTMEHNISKCNSIPKHTMYTNVIHNQSCVSANTVKYLSHLEKIAKWFNLIFSDISYNSISNILISITLYHYDNM